MSDFVFHYLVLHRNFVSTASNSACGMGEIRNAHKILIGESGGKTHLGDLDVDGRIILQLILKK
jgi:hypothetical protein